MNALLKNRLGLVAILRGLEPERAVEVAQVVFDAGIDMIEVPLNSPAPFRSIAAIVAALGDKALIGAGTVLTTDDVDRLADTGAKLMVSPNTNPAVIAHAAESGLVSLPGALTPSEMFAALEAGAIGLKLFPAELASPAALKAVRAVLPSETPVYVVGGIDGANMGEYLDAGAAGFGIGSAIFKPGKMLSDIADGAAQLVAAYRAAQAR